MADIKLAIKMPESIWAAIQNGEYCGVLDDQIYNVIKNGTPLTPNTLADTLMEERIRGKLDYDTTFEKDIIPDVKCRLTVSIRDHRPCYCGAELREVWRESEVKDGNSEIKPITNLYDDCEEVEEKKKAVVIRKCPRIIEFKEKLKSGLIKVGDELVTTDIDGEAVFIVAHLKDGKAYMVRKWLLDNSEERPLIDHEFNAFEWLNGEYRKTLSEELQEMIVGDVTLPSEKEVFGQNRYGLDEEGEQFEWFKTVTNRVTVYRSDDEYTRWWWTRTKADKISASDFAYVNGLGYECYATPSLTWYGLRPHVILKA